MDVAGQDREIRLVLDQLGPVAALEEVPAMAGAGGDTGAGVTLYISLFLWGDTGRR